MKCPKCNQEVKPVKSERWGRSWSCCGLRTWDENRPMIDSSTRTARQKAHRSFDALWKTGKLLRREAYQRLAKEMGLTIDECHMSLMDRETAARVPIAVRKIICQLRKENRFKTKVKQFIRKNPFD